MLRVLAFAALLTPVAVDGAEISQSEATKLNAGDVICVGYDSQTASCLVKQVISQSEDDDITTLEQMRLIDFGSPLILTTFTTSERRGSRYCLKPKTSRAVVEPEIHHSGPLLTVATVEGLNRYAQADFCLEYRPCGDQHIALAYAGDLRFADEDMLYTLFRDGDAETASLVTREMKIAELDAIKGFAPVSCQPKP